MDCKVEWSPEALKDIEFIARYISRDSVFYASAVVEKLLRIGRELAQFPLSGRIVPEINDKSIRERIVYGYRLIYRLQDETITVAAVIHGKRLLDPIRERIQ